METETSTDTNRRRSGRTIRKPELFAEEHHERNFLGNGSVKRKRKQTEDDNVEDHNDSSNSTSSEEDEEEPDEEELKERRRTSRNGKVVASHPAKRPKTNGASTTLAIRSANIPAQPRSKAARTAKARARPSQLHQEDLYAEVFGRGMSGEDVAADWYKTLESNNVDAICDLVNFMLKCVGCDSRVESHDIEDLDNVPSRLGDILDEFQVNKDAEYPLISKLKQFTGFREVLEDFFRALVQSLHTSGTLYNDEAVFDNIQTWVATMSAASLRPFRHTATVISLTMSNALCDIASQLQNSIALSRKQRDTEKSKKSVNKGRVKTIEDSINSNEKKMATIDLLLKDSFDTVFVHRYRDVDEKIRVDCADALGYWIITYRKMFLEGQYLRYLGWVLSDTNMHTRLEVIRQLKALYKEKRNIAALRAFTERFRSRLVEMGARDADIGVRTEAIELLDRLRDAELLEPDDIDTIGRLIFDVEPRVRKAVSKFFVANLDDLYKASIEEIDSEQYEATLPKTVESENYLTPSQAWIRFKCLVQMLGGYDADGESEEDGRDQSKEEIIGENSDSRYMLATLAIFPHMEDLQNWESLAGYLLYDHSQVNTRADHTDVALAVQSCYKLESGEERILLDVLYTSAKLYLQQIVEAQSDRKGKRTNKAKSDMEIRLGDAAHSLTVIIPQLLNKLGSIPQAAAAILRLEQLLNIDLINDLAQGDVTTAALLEDINKQFVSHSDRKVLAEASKALRQARSYEQSRAAADAKVQEIWDDSIGTLQSLLKGQDLDTRGTLALNVLTEVCNTLTRLSNLAGVSDCTAVIERKLPPSATSKRQKAKSSPEMTLFELLLQLTRRGVPDEDLDEEIVEVEDEMCLSAIATLSLYFRWKLFGVKSAVEANQAKSPVLSVGSLTNLALHRQAFVEALAAIVVQRTPLDRVRIHALMSALDVFTLFATAKHLQPSKKGSQELSDDTKINLKSLVVQVPAELIREVMASHAALERAFARRTKRKIVDQIPREKKEVAVEDAPIDSDDEQGQDEEDDDDETDEDILGGKGKDAKKAAALLAEQRLCELTSKLVLGIIGAVVPDPTVVKERLSANRTKLGKSYAQVMAYLEEKKKKPQHATTKASGKPVSDPQRPHGGDDESRKQKAAASEQLVLEEDDIEDDERMDEEALRSRGLHDDDDEEEDEHTEGEVEEQNDPVDDEIMGD